MCLRMKDLSAYDLQSAMMVLFLKRGGYWTGVSLREMTTDRDLFALNRKSQSFAH